jgi:Septin
VKYIKDQHSAYLRKELTAMRDRYIQDTRIHCCLYFINPTGHSLRPIDVIVMKKLSEVVNVVPVIAKADSLTLEEREAFKQKVGDTSGSVVFVLTFRLSDYRSGQNSSTTASASIHLILTSMMKRKCNLTRAFGCVLFSTFVVDLNRRLCAEHDSIRGGWFGEERHHWWKTRARTEKSLGSCKR